MIEIAKVAPHLLVTGGILALLFLSFIVIFLPQGVFLLWKLRGILKGIKSFKGKASPKDLEELFSKDRRIAHLWSEYQESLHEQYEEQNGQLKVAAVRSTITADTFFNTQFIVEGRLHTEFFKHLPGIFTGLGIIGTFSGLIEGLRHFKVNENPSTVRTSLESLMSAVGDAFWISAAAITAAMLATLAEKFLLSWLFQTTEEIAQEIDACFEGGAGEEYLARLVSASEATASQSKILKDALVKELGDLLRELTTSQVASGQQLHAQLAQRIEDSANRQVAAAREDNQVLGGVIAQSIERSLKAPLDKIANSVETASGDQSSTAVKMLNDIMVSFSQRLNDLFGGQINGINELNNQTAQSMQSAVAALNTLVGKLEESGKKTTDDMAAQMTASIKAMEERQGSINTQTQEFVDQIRQLVQSSQTETQQKLQATLGAIGQQMTNIINGLQESQAKVFADNRTREDAMTERASNTVSAMTGSVEAAIKEIALASQTMAQSVANLTAATTDTVDKMNTGANRLDTAATNFASAGDRVTGALEQASRISNKFTELSGALTTGASALHDALRDYKVQREATASLLANVRTTIEMASKEASLTGEVLQRIENSTNKLSQAQKAADEYLDGISKVLAESSSSFQNEVVSTLGKVNYAFQEKLSSAVGLLSMAVEELEATLGSLAPRK